MRRERCGGQCLLHLVHIRAGAHQLAVGEPVLVAVVVLQAQTVERLVRKRERIAQRREVAVDRAEVDVDGLLGAFNMDLGTRCIVRFPLVVHVRVTLLYILGRRNRRVVCMAVARIVVNIRADLEAHSAAAAAPFPENLVVAVFVGKLRIVRLIGIAVDQNHIICKGVVLGLGDQVAVNRDLCKLRLVAFHRDFPTAVIVLKRHRHSLRIGRPAGVYRGGVYVVIGLHIRRYIQLHRAHAIFDRDGRVRDKRTFFVLKGRAAMLLAAVVGLRRIVYVAEDIRDREALQRIIGRCVRLLRGFAGDLNDVIHCAGGLVVIPSARRGVLVQCNRERRLLRGVRTGVARVKRGHILRCSDCNRALLKRASVIYGTSLECTFLKCHRLFAVRSIVRNALHDEIQIRVGKGRLVRSGLAGDVEGDDVRVNASLEVYPHLGILVPDDLGSLLCGIDSMRDARIFFCVLRKILFRFDRNSPIAVVIRFTDSKAVCNELISQLMLMIGIVGDALDIDLQVKVVRSGHRRALDIDRRDGIGLPDMHTRLGAADVLRIVPELEGELVSACFGVAGILAVKGTHKRGNIFDLAFNVIPFFAVERSLLNLCADCVVRAGPSVVFQAFSYSIIASVVHYIARDALGSDRGVLVLVIGGRVGLIGRGGSVFFPDRVDRLGAVCMINFNLVFRLIHSGTIPSVRPALEGVAFSGRGILGDGRGSLIHRWHPCRVRPTTRLADAAIRIIIQHKDWPPDGVEGLGGGCLINGDRVARRTIPNNRIRPLSPASELPAVALRGVYFTAGDGEFIRSLRARVRHRVRYIRDALPVAVEVQGVGFFGRRLVMGNVD